MDTRQPLSLQEEILLLALRDREGTFCFASHLPYALGGALLAELFLAGRVRVNAADRKKRVEVVNPKPVGDPLLDEALERIAAARRPAALPAWVDRLARGRRLKHRIAETLCDRGILRLREKEVLLLFRKRIYPELDDRPERELRRRLLAALESDAGSTDARTLTLLSLLSGAELLGWLLPRRELRPRRNRIRSLVAGEAVGAAVAEAVQSAQAAAAAACCVAATAA